MQHFRITLLLAMLVGALFLWQYVTWSTFSPDPFWMSDTHPYGTFFALVHVNDATARVLYVFLPAARIPFGAAIASGYGRPQSVGSRIYLAFWGDLRGGSVAEYQRYMRRGTFWLAAASATFWWLGLVGLLLAARRLRAAWRLRGRAA